MGTAQIAQPVVSIVDVKDKLIAPEGDATFSGVGEMKQTKKRKAVAQPAAQDLSLHVCVNRSILRLC